MFVLQDVARCLASVGVPYALNMISEDGLLALGLALPDRYNFQTYILYLLQPLDLLLVNRISSLPPEVHEGDLATEPICQCCTI